jgi:succinate dehydrogenase flavin-adding protein (antitoxin of CptAB toxin-antitoxin module)
MHHQSTMLLRLQKVFPKLFYQLGLNSDAQVPLSAALFSANSALQSQGFQSTTTPYSQGLGKKAIIIDKDSFPSNFLHPPQLIDLQALIQCLCSLHIKIYCWVKNPESGRNEPHFIENIQDLKKLMSLESFADADYQTLASEASRDRSVLLSKEDSHHLMSWFNQMQRVPEMNAIQTQGSLMFYQFSEHINTFEDLLEHLHSTKDNELGALLQQHWHLVNHPERFIRCLQACPYYIIEQLLNQYYTTTVHKEQRQKYFPIFYNHVVKQVPQNQQDAFLKKWLDQTDGQNLYDFILNIKDCDNPSHAAQIIIDHYQIKLISNADHLVLYLLAHPDQDKKYIKDHSHLVTEKTLPALLANCPESTQHLMDVYSGEISNDLFLRLMGYCCQDEQVAKQLIANVQPFSKSKLIEVLKFWKRIGGSNSLFDNIESDKIENIPEDLALALLLIKNPNQALADPQMQSHFECRNFGGDYLYVYFKAWLTDELAEQFVHAVGTYTPDQILDCLQACPSRAHLLIKALSSPRLAYSGKLKGNQLARALKYCESYPNVALEFITLFGMQIESFEQLVACISAFPLGAKELFSCYQKEISAKEYEATMVEIQNPTIIKIMDRFVHHSGVSSYANLDTAAHIDETFTETTCHLKIATFHQKTYEQLLKLDFTHMPQLAIVEIPHCEPDDYGRLIDFLRRLPPNLHIYLSDNLNLATANLPPGQKYFRVNYQQRDIRPQKQQTKAASPTLYISTNCSQKIQDVDNSFVLLKVGSVLNLPPDATRCPEVYVGEVKLDLQTGQILDKDSDESAPIPLQGIDKQAFADLIVAKKSLHDALYSHFQITLSANQWTRLPAIEGMQNLLAYYADAQISLQKREDGFYYAHSNTDCSFEYLIQSLTLEWIQRLEQSFNELTQKKDNEILIERVEEIKKPDPNPFISHTSIKLMAYQRVKLSDIPAHLIESPILFHTNTNTNTNISIMKMSGYYYVSSNQNCQVDFLYSHHEYSEQGFNCYQIIINMINRFQSPHSNDHLLPSLDEHKGNLANWIAAVFRSLKGSEKLRAAAFFSRLIQDQNQNLQDHLKLVKVGNYKLAVLYRFSKNSPWLRAHLGSDGTETFIYPATTQMDQPPAPAVMRPNNNPEEFKEAKESKYASNEEEPEVVRQWKAASAPKEVRTAEEFQRVLAEVPTGNILCATGRIEKTVLFLLQTSKRPIYYVRDPNALDLGVEQILIDEHGQPQITHVGQLQQVLEQEKDAILLFDMQNATAQTAVQLNSTLDSTGRKIRGLNIPPGFQRIDLYQRLPDDRSLCSRYNVCVNSHLFDPNLSLQTSEKKATEFQFY